MAAKVNPLLSIVMPIYNEEECIEGIVTAIHSSILAKLDHSELLAIDDGSVDSTPSILDNLCRRFPEVITLHKENGGHGDALLYGLAQAKGEYIFLTDSDGQTNPEDFWLLWNRRNGSEFISGVRANRQDPFHRLVIARLVRFAIWAVFGVRCRDANVPFKLFSRELWQRTQSAIPRDSLTPSLLLSLAANRSARGFDEISIRHSKRTTGTCTIRYLKLIRFCMKAMVQLLRFRWSTWNTVEKVK